MSDGRLVADGPAAANIPGVVGGLDYLYRKYGSGKVQVGRADRAGNRARRGRVHPRRSAADEHRGRPPFSREVSRGGAHLPARREGAAAGRSLRQQGLRGDAARASPRMAPRRSIAATSRARLPPTWKQNGGIIDLRRISRSTAPSSVSRSSGQYRGHTLYAGGPPVSTGIQLFESLQMLENYQPRPGARTTTDADYFHHLIEAWKVRDPLRRVADPERWPVDFAEHLTARARARSCSRRSIRARRRAMSRRVPRMTGRSCR